MTRRNDLCVSTKALLLALLLFFCALAASAAQAPERDLTELSSTIKGKLTDLKAQSASMTALCETLQDSLKSSQEELQAWKEQSTSLSSSLTTINERLNDSYKTLIEYETRLKRRAKVIAALILILGLRIFTMVLGYALYAKGVNLPRWLDILL